MENDDIFISVENPHLFPEKSLFLRQFMPAAISSFIPFPMGMSGSGRKLLIGFV
jgi:hypothetical protein